MKIITEPIVTIVGKTEFIEHPEYDIPEDGTTMERLGAFAAKGCYNTYGKEGRPCVENQREVIKHGHGSVSEHMVVSLHIEGITRALSLELNRHRPFSISQRSTRYTKEEEGAIVLDPYFASLFKTARKDTEKQQMPIEEYGIIDYHLSSSQRSLYDYSVQVEQLMDLNPYKKEGFDLRKWARGKARNVLPHNLETRGVWTMNIRAIRHFIELRSGIGAEEEIRRLVYHVYLAVKDLAPVYFEDYELIWPEKVIEECEVYPVIHTPNRKI